MDDAGTSFAVLDGGTLERLGGLQLGNPPSVCHSHTAVVDLRDFGSLASFSQPAGALCLQSAASVLGAPGGSDDDGDCRYRMRLLLVCVCGHVIAAFEKCALSPGG